MLLAYTLYGIGGLLTVLILTVIIRTLAFVPSKTESKNTSLGILADDGLTASLAEMVKCATVSSRDKSLEDNSEFERFKSLLPRLFPKVYDKCENISISDRSILLKWSGRNHKDVTVLMSHYDVVEADSEGWQHNPFGGQIVDGYLWGRGTLDTKCTINGILSAAERLIGEGFVPENDIYFAFGGDEEINGHGASDIVEYFAQKNITPAFVLDEGGAVTEGAFPGVKSPIALIGIAEKGLLNVEYSIKGGGGHASAPNAKTPIGRLSAACVRIEHGGFDYHLTEPAELLFNTAGRHSTLLYRVIFANLWLFGPVLSLIAKQRGGELNAMLRTTTAFTMMEGSRGVNVIPSVAKMASNHRILPGESVETTVDRIKRLADDDGIEIRVINSHEPSVISKTDCDAYRRLCDIVGEVWQNAIVSPYLMVACTDSRHWGRICDRVYRFSPLELSNELRSTIHGNDERIPTVQIAKCTEFYSKLMKKI